VLDAFCGSGTTLIASQLLNRRWIGIDESEAAIRVCLSRLSATPDQTLFSSAPNFVFYKQQPAPLKEQRARMPFMIAA
jgi:adenine-specific DNA-methyltransferase